MKAFVAAIVLCMVSFAALAGETAEAIVEKWYAALAAVDRPVFETLLSEKAVIKLEDIGIEQTKAEFIESLDEWEDAVKGTTIRHKVESASPSGVVVSVCYTFAANERLTREDFTIEAGKIVYSRQGPVANSCQGYFK